MSDKKLNQRKLKMESKGSYRRFITEGLCAKYAYKYKLPVPSQTTNPLYAPIIFFTKEIAYLQGKSMEKGLTI